MRDSLKLKCSLHTYMTYTGVNTVCQTLNNNYKTENMTEKIIPHYSREIKVQLSYCPVNQTTTVHEKFV
jgi:hypothetical protein